MTYFNKGADGKVRVVIRENKGGDANSGNGNGADDGAVKVEKVGASESTSKSAVLPSPPAKPPGLRANLDLSAIEEAAYAFGDSVRAIAGEIRCGRDTLNRHRERDPQVEAAIERGCVRRRRLMAKGGLNVLERVAEGDLRGKSIWHHYANMAVEKGGLGMGNQEKINIGEVNIKVEIHKSYLSGAPYPGKAGRVIDISPDAALPEPAEAEQDGPKLD